MNPVMHENNEYNKILTKFKEDEKHNLEEFLLKNKEKIGMGENEYEITIEEIKLTFDNFPYSEVLKRVLPKEIDEYPSSYEIIGKIAHLNLREKFLPYKNLIGELIINVK